jgi:hypothetical protein
MLVFVSLRRPPTRECGAGDVRRLTSGALGAWEEGIEVHWA